MCLTNHDLSCSAALRTNVFSFSVTPVGVVTMETELSDRRDENLKASERSEADELMSALHLCCPKYLL